MAKANLSTKRLAIDKANLTVIIVVSVAVFVTVFSLVASKSLLSQRAYQAKVISKKEAALKQAKTNVKNSEQLIASYQKFISEPQNTLGGNPQGTGDKDGQNSRIILDALPSKYDFPALTTSLDKLVSGNGFKVSSITGNDDEAAQAANKVSSAPQPIEMPFTVEATVPGVDAKRFMELFERSIRPIEVQKVVATGRANELKITVTAKTYFQPAKNLDVKQEKVK